MAHYGIVHMVQLGYMLLCTHTTLDTTKTERAQQLLAGSLINFCSWKLQQSY